MIRSSSTVILIFQSCIEFLFITSVDSGHGGQVKDETGKECDGMDEGTEWSILVQLSNLFVNLFSFFFDLTSFSYISGRFSIN